MSKRKPKSKRINPRYRAIAKELERLGHTNVRVWWEPLGPSMEMCGPTGGYFFKSDDDHFEPLGWDFDMALRAAKRSKP